MSCASNPIGLPLLYLQVLYSWPTCILKRLNTHSFSKVLHLKKNITQDIYLIYIKPFLMFKSFFKKLLLFLTYCFTSQVLHQLLLLSGCIWVISKPCCQTPFHSLISNISTKLSTSPYGILCLNITFLLSFFQKSNNELCNCVTNFFQNLSVPRAHTTWYGKYIRSFTFSKVLHSLYPPNSQ